MNITLQYGPTLPKGHQTWQMNEINKLIWPSASGHRGHGQGRLHPDGRDREAVRRDQEGAVGGAYRTDLAAKAVAALKAAGVDVNGTSWKPAKVNVTAGGK